MTPDVCIVEDHLLLGQLVEIQLCSAGISSLVVDLDDRLIEAIAASGARVALLDVELGDELDSLVLCRRLSNDGLSVVLFTGVVDEAVLGQYLEAGAKGILAKSDDLEGVVAQLRAALEGMPIGPGPVRRNRMIETARRHHAELTEAMEPFEQLSPSEAEVLGLLLEGLAAGDIARRRFVSLTTIRAQIRSIHQKLGVSSQLGAVSLANSIGWRPAITVL